MFEDLKAEFEEAIYELSTRIAKELGDRPNGLRYLIRQNSGLGAAKVTLHRTVSPGFRRLQAAGRLDLTVERLIRDPRFRALFTDDELDIARTRLQEAGWTEAA